MSLGEYIHKNVLGPANLTDTFYWNGAPGSQPTGLRHRMLPVPAYITQFTGKTPLLGRLSLTSKMVLVQTTHSNNNRNLGDLLLTFHVVFIDLCTQDRQAQHRQS